MKKFKQDISFNILVTSISVKIPMLKAIRNACKKFGNQISIYGGDADPNCIGRYFVDTFWQMPQISELTSEKVIEYCIRNNIKAIIPSRDGELHFWSSIKETLSTKGIKTMVSCSNGIEICIDKLLFSQTLISKKIQAIPTFTTADEVKTDRFVAKERFGAGSINIALNVTKEGASQYAEKLEAPIFQPFIRGKEYSVDVYIDKKGKAKGAIARTRDLIVNGESQITTTVSNPKLESLCGSVVETLQLYGHIVLQILEDESGNYYIIECNSRFGGASTLSVVSGLDSFYWFLLESSGVDISEYPFIRSKIEKTQVRFPEDIVIHDTGI